MRIVTAEFNVTLDIAIPDHLDAEWVVDKYNFSERFGVSPLRGDPDSTHIVSSSSGGEIKRIAKGWS